MDAKQIRENLKKHRNQKFRHKSERMLDGWNKTIQAVKDNWANGSYSSRKAFVSKDNPLGKLQHYDKVLATKIKKGQALSHDIQKEIYYKSWGINRGRKHWQELAEEYNVSYSMIFKIVHGSKLRWITKEEYQADHKAWVEKYKDKRSNIKSGFNNERTNIKFKNDPKS